MVHRRDAGKKLDFPKITDYKLLTFALTPIKLFYTFHQNVRGKYGEGLMVTMSRRLNNQFIKLSSTQRIIIASSLCLCLSQSSAQSPKSETQVAAKSLAATLELIRPHAEFQEHAIQSYRLKGKYFQRFYDPKSAPNYSESLKIVMQFVPRGRIDEVESDRLLDQLIALEKEKPLGKYKWENILVVQSGNKFCCERKQIQDNKFYLLKIAQNETNSAIYDSEGSVCTLWLGESKVAGIFLHSFRKVIDCTIFDRAAFSGHDVDEQKNLYVRGMTHPDEPNTPPTTYKIEPETGLLSHISAANGDHIQSPSTMNVTGICYPLASASLTRTQDGKLSIIKLLFIESLETNLEFDNREFDFDVHQNTKIVDNRNSCRPVIYFMGKSSQVFSIPEFDNSKNPAAP